MESKIIDGRRWYGYSIKYRYGRSVCFEKLWALSLAHANILLTDIREAGKISFGDRKAYGGSKTALFYDYPVIVDSPDGEFTINILGESDMDAQMRFDSLRSNAIIVEESE